MRDVYFDHQSATPLSPEVIEAMRPWFGEHFGAPASLHRRGLKARDALAMARERVAALINAESAEEIIFTSGGTESANLTVQGAAWANQRRGNHIVLSATEHPSVSNSAAFLEKHGFSCTRVPVDPEGRVDPEAVRAALTDKTILVCVHHANHDIGTIEPIAEIGRITGERGIAFFVDATASGGWLPLDVQAMGASLLSLAPHRFYGPKGAGVLYRNRRARLVGILHGGDQEGGRRAGTENVPAIVGAGVAAEIARRELPARMKHLANLQGQLWDGLVRRVTHIQINGPLPGPSRSPANLNFSTEFVEGEGLALFLDMQGIAVASGAGCVTKELAIPPVLEAIGLDSSLARANLILTLGQGNTAEDVEYFLDTFEKAVERLRGMSPAWDEFKQGKLASAIKHF